MTKDLKRARGAFNLNIANIVIFPIFFILFLVFAGTIFAVATTSRSEEGATALAAGVGIGLIFFWLFGIFEFGIWIAALVLTALAANIKNQEKNTKTLLWVGFGLSFVFPLIGAIIAIVGAAKLKKYLLATESTNKYY
ncbi:hypothetical protein FJO69_00505 [[Mycoplasma] falconis]|uniref:Uncharacterized protein n=1 Tax=[Mycoplasma] falconis TaxID=92403 RepID=A0A501XBW1_9BACT|nr:hypothetical protein [[Mycoplasma] falconis]TPE58075.1 hypothetical protein FJO69_00505 [[Mycoplasma] falconis]